MADTVEHVGQGSERWAAIRGEFMTAQAGQCAICRNVVDEPQLDHCHSSGFIRGVLCTHCNTRLGWYEANREGIERYLGLAAEFTAHRVNERMSREDRLRHHWQTKVLD